MFYLLIEGIRKKIEKMEKKFCEEIKNFRERLENWEIINFLVFIFYN